MFEGLNPPYKVILADCPWHYRDKRKGNGGAADHYSLLKTWDLIKMPVGKLADQDAMLFMWATDPNLLEALEVMNAWGFPYKTQAFTWVKFYKGLQKPVFGLGQYTRANAEVCLLGLKGRRWRASNSVSSLIMSERGRHSEKPAEARSRIERLCGDVPKVELFARERVPGWSSWGQGLPPVEPVTSAVTTDEVERETANG